MKINRCLAIHKVPKWFSLPNSSRWDMISSRRERVRKMNQCRSSVDLIGSNDNPQRVANAIKLWLRQPWGKDTWGRWAALSVDVVVGLLDIVPTIKLKFHDCSFEILVCRYQGESGDLKRVLSELDMISRSSWDIVSGQASPKSFRVQLLWGYGGHGKKLPECQECQDFRLGISSLLPPYLKWVLFGNNCY